MKTSIKAINAFACVIVALALFACSSSEPDSDYVSPRCKASAKPGQIYAKSGQIYISYDVYDGPNDPTVVIIVGDVKDWMDEQLASGGKEKKLIWISMSDLPLLKNPIEEPEVSGTYNPETGEYKFFVNGQEMTIDEHKEFVNAWAEESMRLKIEIIEAYKATIHIPGEEVEDVHGGWKALMTAEDIVELTENNEGLAISFFSYPTTMPGGEWNDSVGGSGGGVVGGASASNANESSCR